MSVTERDVFLSIHPHLLLASWSRDQLEAWFGPSNRSEQIGTYIDELINDINRKYRRIELIKWDPSPNPFYDYGLERVISIDELNQNFNQYSAMSLQKLGQQLTISLSRWLQNNNENVQPFIDLNNRINERIQQIARTQVIVE